MTPGTYQGARNLLIPSDLGLSLLAKRSYLAYRLWSRYRALTDPLFTDGPPPPAAVDAAAVEQLRQRGYLIERTMFTDAEVAGARAFVMDLFAEAQEKMRREAPPESVRQFNWKERGIDWMVDRKGGRTRVLFTEAYLSRPEVPELLRKFSDIPHFRALAGAYFGTRKLLNNEPYFMAEIMGPNEFVEPWHIDCIRPTLKVYLTLDDVGPEQAPLKYVPGTHHLDEERHRLFYSICNGGLGHAYFDADRCAQLDRRCIEATAPANRFIVFDNQGFHAGNKCREGYRIVLANGYRPWATARLNPRLFRDPAPVPYPWERPV